MNLQNRLEKLEQVTGINEPCEVCEAADVLMVKVADFNKSIGFESPKSAPDDIVTEPCGWCLRPTVYSNAGHSKELRALFERLRNARQQGTCCAPENANLYEEAMAACKAQEREWYGEHYETIAALIDDFYAEVVRISARTAPREIYLCRVPGCACHYPKTEEEWQANVKRRLAA